jgi:hypothetical protein
VTGPEWVIVVALPLQLLCLVGTVRNAWATQRSLERTAETWRQVAQRTAQTNVTLLGMALKAEKADD